jgi:hypothetical protein
VLDLVDLLSCDGVAAAKVHLRCMLTPLTMDGQIGSDRVFSDFIGSDRVFSDFPISDGI